MGCEETTPLPDAVSRTITVKTGKFVTSQNRDNTAVTTVTYEKITEITEKIVADGTVVAEIDLGTEGKEWSALPLTRYFKDSSDNDHVVSIETRYKKDTFMLLLRGTYASVVAGGFEFGDYRLRVIVISGDAAGG